MALLACCALTSCVPWVVRPIDDTHAEKFDATRYVDSIWAKVVAEPSLSRSEGRVARTEEGRIVLDSGAIIQTGPVIRGTALRDALPFIQFSQFTNQLEYARVANVLNDRAAIVAAAAQVKTGDMVRYAGAASADGIVPVVLERR
jgi:predicted lipoprotein